MIGYRECETSGKLVRFRLSIPGWKMFLAFIQREGNLNMKGYQKWTRRIYIRNNAIYGIH